LHVLYKTTATEVMTPAVHPILEVRNAGTLPVPLKELALRYYYTRDNAPGEQATCLSVSGPVTCNEVTLLFEPYAPIAPHADAYYQVGFTLGTLPPGATIVVDSSFAKTQGNYEQSGDYSWDASKTDFGETEMITLHRNGVLIWGKKP
jgi:mannan endo-1,4-beta-mannosidase